MVVVMIVAAVVNGLLLTATGLLLGKRPNLQGLIVGSMLCGVLAGLNLLPGLAFLGNCFVRLCCLLLSVLLSFGFRVSSARSVVFFLVLQLTVTGISQAERLPSMLLCALGIGAVSLFGSKEERLIPVELSYRGKTLSLNALRDTGNTLRDPVTGRQVLIVGADIAGILTGLTPSQLENPVSTVGIIPGLRLIPYKTVGNTGFLLAMKIADAKIGNRQGSTIVAFSPNSLGSNYQALTGGAA